MAGLNPCDTLGHRLTGALYRESGQPTRVSGHQTWLGGQHSIRESRRAAATGELRLLKCWQEKPALQDSKPRGNTESSHWLCHESIGATSNKAGQDL